MNSMSSSTAIQSALQAAGHAGFLAEVEAVLERALVDEKGQEARDTLMAAGRHLVIGGGGKRARPLLLRLFADACGAPLEALPEVGAAAELIHSASLLHDDVVDAGMFRRGRPTVNARWGNITAVMAGDMILSTALSLLSRVDSRLVTRAIELVMEMTRAAIAEVEARGDLSLPLDRLRFIQEGKTGALFGWCGAAAATLSGNAEAARRFESFGRHLGIAFQIADDLRDLTGDDGKPQYADIQSRTPSMPLLLAVAGDDSLRRKLREAWAFSAMTPDRVRELGLAIQASGAMQAAHAKLLGEIEAGVDALGPYATAPGGSELVDWGRRLAEGARPERA